MDKNQCSEEVWDGSSWTTQLCRKKAKVTTEGKRYCTIHDPIYIKNKDLEAEIAYRAKDCKKCDFNFTDRQRYSYCPICGTKKNAKN